MDNALFLEKLRAFGVDVNGTLERFIGNEELFIKFILRFPNDEKLIRLRAAIEAKDYEEALTISHSLKGETGNLGINPLYKTFSQMVDDIRAETYTRLEEQYDTAIEYYREICKIIKEKSA